MHFVLAAIAAFTLAAAVRTSAQTSVQKHVTSSASTGVSVSTVNGQSVVTFNGQQVFSGPTKGHVSSRSSNSNGVEYAAVYDGHTLLWENVPGAAQQLQSAHSAPAAPDHKQFMDQHQQTVERMKEEQRKFMEAHGGTNIAHGTGVGSHGGGSVSTGGGVHKHSESHSVSQSGNVSISTKPVNGSTVITYQGKEISVGPTQGQISTKAKSINSKDYAAAFDGERVIWENVPGAAQQVK